MTNNTEDAHGAAIVAVEELRASIEGQLTLAACLSWTSDAAILVATLASLADLVGREGVTG